MVLPATMKRPFPRWWRVLGFLRAGFTHALTALRMKKLYFSTKVLSATTHSILAQHWGRRGAWTREAGRVAMWNFLNLSVWRPVEFPTPTTVGANSTVPAGLDHAEGVIPLAEDEADQGRLEVHHHVPGEGHHVGPADPRGRHQHHRARLQQPVDARKRIGFQSRLFHSRFSFRTPAGIFTGPSLRPPSPPSGPPPPWAFFRPG